jgi:hypothetical protein
MAPRSKISQLPPEDKKWLDNELTTRNFSDYLELAELLQERGYEISHAAVHRHGQKLEKTLARIKLSTEAALLIAEAVPDSQDSRSAAVISMLQTGLFDALTELQDVEKMEPEKRVTTLAKASQGFSKLVEASLSQKRFADEVKKRLDLLEKAAGKKGKPKIDAETLRQVREALYGV